jgi:hypothetical protein
MPTARKALAYAVVPLSIILDVLVWHMARGYFHRLRPNVLAVPEEAAEYLCFIAIVAIAITLADWIHPQAGSFFDRISFEGRRTAAQKRLYGVLIGAMFAVLLILAMLGAFR